jgi:hypothetical protein
MNPSSKPASGTTPAPRANSIHQAWRESRDAALAEFFAGFKGLTQWGSATTVDAARDNRLWIGFATVSAECAGAHDAASEGYFRLVTASQGGNELLSSGRLWYARSLKHAQRAANDFAIGRAAYWLGLIDASNGLIESARRNLLTSRDHAEKADNPGGKAASLYQLSQLAMASYDATMQSVALKAVTDYAVESYVTSRNAGHLQQSASTLTGTCQRE